MGLFGFLSGKNASLLALQKIVMKNSPNQLVMSEKQLRSAARKQASQHLRICKDSIRLIEHTTSPKVFFSRLDLFFDNLSALKELEKHISFTGSPSKTLARFHSSKQDVIHDFLIRYHKDIVSQAESAKTPQGKQGKYKKFEESLQPYFAQMNANNIMFVKTHSSMN